MKLTIFSPLSDACVLLTERKHLINMMLTLNIWKMLIDNLKLIKYSIELLHIFVFLYCVFVVIKAQLWRPTSTRHVIIFIYLYFRSTHEPYVIILYSAFIDTHFNKLQLPTWLYVCTWHVQKYVDGVLAHSKAVGRGPALCRTLNVDYLQSRSSPCWCEPVLWLHVVCFCWKRRAAVISEQH